MKSIRIKTFLLMLLTAGLAISQPLSAQDSAGDYFNRAAKQYVNADKAATEQTLAEGLNKFPNDQKMRALQEKLKKEEEEQQQQQDQKDQQNGQDQQPKDESQDQKKGEGDEQTEDDPDVESEKTEDKRGEKSQQDKPTESDQESDLSERDKQMQQLKEKLEQMNITPQQAAQILDAMNDAELRHIQQNKRKPTKQPERGLPDW